MNIKNSFSAVIAKPSKILTKAELLQKIKDRAKPTPLQHLTPNNWQSGSIQQQSNDLDENRIDHIQKAFKKISAKAKNNHRNSALKGITKQSFNTAKTKGRGFTR